MENIVSGVPGEELGKFLEEVMKEKSLITKSFKVLEKKFEKYPREILTCPLDLRVGNYAFFTSAYLGTCISDHVDYEISKFVYNKGSFTTSLSELLELSRIIVPSEKDELKVSMERRVFMTVQRYLANGIVHMDRHDYDIHRGLSSFRLALAQDHRITKKYLKSNMIIIQYINLCMNLMYTTGKQLLKESRPKACLDYFKVFFKCVPLGIKSQIFENGIHNYVSKFFETCYYIEDTHRMNEKECKFANMFLIESFQFLSQGRKAISEKIETPELIQEELENLEIPFSISIEFFENLNDQDLMKQYLKRSMEKLNKKHYSIIHGFRYPQDPRNRGYYVKRSISAGRYRSFSNYFKICRRYVKKRGKKRFKPREEVDSDEKERLLYLKDVDFEKFEIDNLEVILNTGDSGIMEFRGMKLLFL